MSATAAALVTVACTFSESRGVPLETVWSREGAVSSRLESPGTTPPVEDIQTQILALSPQNDGQRWIKSEALKLSEEVVKTRWRVLAAGAGAVPVPFLLVVIFWLTVTFASFGLYAPRNLTVTSVLFVAAVSVGAAVFLILELDGPFDGQIRVSSGPLRYALANLGQ